MFNYCPQCGSPLRWQECKGRQRQVCPRCHYVLWSNDESKKKQGLSPGLGK
ncbi:zinc ribbon domain-containing protein [uncultured Limosilactobacillus sp.]|uniref:zinc ribbon domain-containing protein n=1 Tax=uncultured Limosilactobacillus sp. TaxID=2837629 RepID=UPI0025E18280|nr:zinc ribbon domain-containing protein [uncultured Limosilactobacillus sp.]